MDEKYMDFYTKSEINAMLDDLSFVRCTQAEYDEMTTHDADTVYIIVEEVQ